MELSKPDPWVPLLDFSSYWVLLNPSFSKIILTPNIGKMHSGRLDMITVKLVNLLFSKYECDTHTWIPEMLNISASLSM